MIATPEKGETDSPIYFGRWLGEPVSRMGSNLPFSPWLESFTAYSTRLEPLNCLKTVSLAPLWLTYWLAMRLATGSARSQSERDLDLPVAAGRRAEGRASGKSGAARSDRRETSGGAVAVEAGAVCNLRHTPAPLVTAVAHGLFEGCTCEIGGESNVGN